MSRKYFRVNKRGQPIKAEKRKCDFLKRESELSASLTAQFFMENIIFAPVLIFNFPVFFLVFKFLIQDYCHYRVYLKL